MDINKLAQQIKHAGLKNDLTRRLDKLEKTIKSVKSNMSHIDFDKDYKIKDLIEAVSKLTGKLSFYE